MVAGYRPPVSRSSRGRWGWIHERPGNWWLRFGIPFTVIFGGGFLLRLFLADELGGATVAYGIGALAGAATLVIGVAIELRKQ